ncbi:hypothetical protein CBS101457_001512 [Exobasidium rhododendri]|nr:hypothetical protein CBS101457_001512 [Exobasidium rhododendri]
MLFFPSTAIVILLTAALIHNAEAGPILQRSRNRGGVVSECLVKQKVPFVDSVRNDSVTYWEASQSDNLRFHFHPIAITYPKDSEEVSRAVKCARDFGNVQVAARSGGHSFAGFGSGGQDGALIIDMQKMNSIVPDSANELAHIGPAARLGDVVKDLFAADKRGMPHGTCPTVGTGGHALCGGFGPTSRMWGMATDNIIEAEVVLADGTIVHASQHENEELWWALRGSGSFFGIVTKFTFSTFDAKSPMTFLEYRWTKSLESVDDIIKIMEGVQSFATDGDMPAEMGWHIQTQAPNAADPPGGIISVSMRGMYAGPVMKYKESVIAPLWKELSKRGAPVKPDAIVEKEMSYLEMFEEWDDFGKAGDKLDTLAERLQRNNFLARTSLSMGQRGLTTRGFREVFTTFWQRAELQSQGKTSKATNEFFSWNIYFEMFGGTNARHRDADLVRQSSMVHRDALWLIQASVGTYAEGGMPHDGYEYINKVDSDLIEALKRDNLERASYSCYADITLENWKELYYGSAVSRLTDLKMRLDPTNLFRNPQSLIDAPSAASQSGLVMQDYANVHPLP